MHISKSTWILLLIIGLVGCQTYRVFPPLTNLARERSVNTTPTDSSCGVPVRSTFCRSSSSPDSISTCIQESCDQICPLRYVLPSHASMLDNAANYDVCVTKDTINTATELTSYSALFNGGEQCYLTPDEGLTVGSSGELTVGFWLRQSFGNAGTIVDKQSREGATIFSLKVSADNIGIDYLTLDGVKSVEFGDNYIPPLIWTHIAVQIYSRFINVYINGTEVGSSPVVAGLLAGEITDVAEGVTRVGQAVNGSSQFVGRLQDLRSYSHTLSNREIDEMMAGVLPELHTQSACRCPASHPRVKPLLSRYCIKNGMGDTTTDQVLRAGANSHPLSFVNDGDTNSIWISTQINEVFITVDLGDTFQVFYVVMQFYSPLPKAVRIQRQQSSGAFWEDWQYYADDCELYFGLENNGALEGSSSVNCLQLSISGTNVVPYSRGNITFNILSQSPIARPGHNDFYNTVELYGFVKASSVRVTMRDHYYANNPKHQYYGIYEFLVTGRCDCNGHADTCDTSVRPYSCQCAADSYTQAPQCSSCLPLYNDKPFKVGDQVNDFNCKECNCYQHADSCIYNQTIDPFPTDHNRGGGGQCVNCRDNTQGVHCETCLDLYYRDLNEELSSPNVCLLCDCNPAGTVDGEAQCDRNGGQCLCKGNVEGRRCDQCKAETYNLIAANPLGCSPCMCDERGVTDENLNCDSLGRCSCKDDVRGDKCSLCDYGFYNLNISHVGGCLPCDCDPRGSTSLFCNPESGECQCKTNIQGFRCEECVDGFWDIDSNCLPCDVHCDLSGSEPGSYCDKSTGQCVCKANVQGHACDECRPSYHNFGSSQLLGCVRCGCLSAGTVNGSTTCLESDGQCDCKDNVEGLTCNECTANTFGLSAGNPAGCNPCDCDPSGTLQGDILAVDQLPCDQNNGTCTCLSNRVGRRCDNCEATFYLSADAGGGCLPCNCHPKGSASLTCDVRSGRCECKLGNSGVSGQRCDSCLPNHYSFDSALGSCMPCDCLAAGSINDTCNPTTGQCSCKQFVEGRQCDVCVAGASDLNADNPFGCSKFPSQQSPPTHVPISPTILQLSWSPPDYPNGVILTYILFRDGQQVAELDPFNLSYNDTGLNPFTTYAYKVRSHNEFGFAESPEVSFRTPPGAPSNDSLVLNVTDVTSHSAEFRWNPFSNYTGTIVLYEGRGLAFSSQELSPYTFYAFTISACTSGGCLRSSPVDIQTPQAAPSGQGDPAVTATSSDSFYIEWQPPTQPNGIIIYYELWMKGITQADGTVNPPLTLIFHPSGQYSPLNNLTLENALPPPATNYTVTGLRPYTDYEFQVLSQNDVSKAASGWVTARTLESAPTFVAEPTVTPISDSTLLIEWIEPSAEQINGEITMYRLSQIFDSDLVANPFDPPTYTREIYSSAVGRNYTVTGLLPYSTHQFKVQVCNSVGCVYSDVVSATTLPAAPGVPVDPIVQSVNSSTLLIEWTEPADLNGPVPIYTVVQSEVAFGIPSPRVVRGTRFPGGGYYRFPPRTLPPNVAFTGIELWFKTSQPSGLLLFLASAGSQEEFVVVQLRDGRPWFLFDPQGCSTAVGIDPSADGNATYSDGSWHHLALRRFGTRGTLTIDFNITGSETSDCATGTIIGSNTGVYVGGLPKDFVISRTESDPRAMVVRQGFQGCVDRMKILARSSPREVWNSLDWSTSTKRSNTYPAWYGCPTSLEHDAVHFPGQGWLVIDNALLLENTNNFQIAVSLRTEYTHGLLFFVYGGRNVYLYAMIDQTSLVFGYRQDTNHTTVRLESVEMNVCGGEWRYVVFSKDGDRLIINVDGIYEVGNGTLDTPTDINIASNLYIGGVPPNTEASRVAEESDLSLTRQFGGCVRELQINGRMVNLQTDVVDFSTVNLDGCPFLQTSQGGCRTSPETLVYFGSFTNQSYATELRPFTDYAYRVKASNSAGSSLTDWIIGTTSPTPPYGVLAPYYAGALTGYSIDLKWSHPTGNTGIIYRYILRAYDLERDGVMVETTFNESTVLQGIMNDTRPHTNYSVHLQACTMGGCTESANGTFVQTLEEAPEEVQAPRIISNGPTYIYIGWDDPLYPNGEITGYLLYEEEELKYSGGLSTFNYTGLQAYTSYLLKVSACTVIGCTDSPLVSLTTDQLPPLLVEPPLLTVFGTRRIDAVWTAPDSASLNGRVERYQVYLSMSPLDLPGDLVYDSMAVEILYYRNESLLAGTTYYVTLGACTGGGCTLSETVNATTVESSPDLVQDPVITALSPYSLQVTWSPPLMSNGIVIRYSLTHNSVPAEYETTDMLEYNATNLLPYSLHVFQLEVCTAQGCTLSNEVTGRTLEAAPQGSIRLQLRLPNLEPREITTKWSRLQTANGVVNYTLYSNGLYYMDAVGGDYTTLRQRRPVFSSLSADEWISVGGLIPYSQYQIQINASNSVGFVLSNVVSVDMPAGAPDGVSPPTLRVIDSTAITAVWRTPGRINGPSPPGVVYQLQFRAENKQAENVFSQNTTATTYTRSDLEPYTDYSFRLAASNEVGTMWSEWTSATTAQSIPASIDPPIVTSYTSRTAELSWSEPGQPNGIIIKYNIYRNDTLVFVVSSETTTMTIAGLSPYTVYVFRVDACTVIGCVRGQGGQPTLTSEDAPEGLSAPTAVSLTSTSVILTWAEPTTPNGNLADYTVERWIDNYTSIVLQTLAPSSSLSYVDEGAQLQPYTLYQYRVSASTAGGRAFSPWVSVRTKSARPSGLSRPVIDFFNSTVIRVLWEAPQSVNGELNRYLVKYDTGKQVRLDPHVTAVTLTGLIAYTEYNVSVVACTDGGCTESPVVAVLTQGSRPGGVQPPQPIVLSQTLVAIQWQLPELPNGPNIRYTLTRMKIRQPLADNPVDIGQWVEAYSGTDVYYEDRELSLYTTYIYQLTVYNDYGYISSDNSSQVVTHGGQPFEPPALTVTTISHTALKADWTIPDEVVLRGSVESFSLFYSNTTHTYNKDVTSASIESLTPNTNYTFILTLYVNGGLSVSSPPVTASTADGAPQGVEPPLLFVVSDTSIRISWTEPLNPNGRIISYKVYMDEERIEAVNTSEPGSYVIDDLLPYTIYEFKLEVCTIYACVESPTIQGTTSEAPPQGLTSPDLQVLSATEVQIRWQEPSSPNGILLRYSLYRRNVTHCSEVTVTESPSMSRCTYVSCGPLEGRCGALCYSGVKACCEGVTYDTIQGYECCGTQYIAGRNSADDVCCGGKFHTRQDNYQCCGDRYVSVLAEETCCVADSGAVSVGFGDACCGLTPYSTTGAQICCAGVLHDGFNQQCCGGRVVSSQMTCCGHTVTGLPYTTANDERFCCGDQYVLRDRTACCISSSNTRKAHIYSSASAMLNSNEQCCELERIASGQSCCNGRGYNPALQVCSDVGDSLSGCGNGSICSIGSAARCNQCDFDLSMSCDAILMQTVREPEVPPPQISEQMCITEPLLIYSGLQLALRDTGLKPWSTYEYSISVTNRAGTQSTSYQPIRTGQSTPTGLAPPTVTITEGQLNVIQLDWLPPLNPNGEILYYSLWRSSGGRPAEIYRGSEFSHTDDDGIQPFRTYRYVLRACTVVEACTESDPVDAATRQAPPESVSAPVAAYVNSTVISLEWTVPAVPNGIIRNYVVYDTTTGLHYSVNAEEPRVLTLTGLAPYTEHNFILSACTGAACTNSTELIIATLQDLPAGIADLQSVIISSTELIINWFEPTHANGLITEYRLLTRSSAASEWLLLYSGLLLTNNQSGLTPGQSYQYQVQIVNGAGSAYTSIYTVRLPTQTPLGLTQPTVARAVSPFSIYVEWEAPTNPGGAIDQYQVIVDAGEPSELSTSLSSTLRAHTVTSLSPYTRYSVRIGACLQGVENSCGTGPPVYVITHEAAPFNQTPPTLTPIAASVVEVSWSEPERANGLVQSYTLYRRLAGSANTAYTVYVSDNATFSFTNVGPDLTPYTQFEYQILVRNGAGETTSEWAQVITLEAPPSGQGQATVISRGPFAAEVSWNPPSNPNGLITAYVINYQEISTDPTFTLPIRSVTVSGSERVTTFSSLSPYTLYRVRVGAHNSAGSVTSDWVQVTTGESVPSDVRPLQAEPRDTGRSILLSWLPPERPNGVITQYIIRESGSDFPLYNGLGLEFVYLRLQPYTNYSLMLEACTSVGCAQGPWQMVTTAEIQPENQPTPTLGEVGSTTVTLRWSPPLSPYGVITKYEVLRLSNGRLSRRAETPTIVYSTTNTSHAENEYTDTELLSYTSYQYKIRSGNSRGSVDSDWVVVETRQAAPEGVLPPTVNHYGSSFEMVLVTWLAPITANGVIQSYQLRRNGSTPWSFTAADVKEFIDRGLSAHTVYSYMITACTSAGCTSSTEQTILTRQSSPMSINSPIIDSLSSTELLVRWDSPVITNGVLIQYNLKMDSILIYSGLNTSVTISDLTPYTQYRFVLQACTGGGCTSSIPALGRTRPEVPSGMSRPILRVVSSTAIEITWTQPAQPNGLVDLYEVLRDNELVYSDDGFLYTDTNLSPDTVYSYTVRATNSRGSVVSPVATARTYMSSPNGLSPPTLSALSSTSIRALWTPPTHANGVITNYTLYDDFSREALYSGLQLSATISGLEFYSMYSIRVQACTAVGCALSMPSSTRTLEGPPSGMERPILTPQATASGAHDGIALVWGVPRKLNGILTGYKVDRRKVLDSSNSESSYSAPVQLYEGEGSRLLDNDSSLRPYSSYEYRVSAYNGAGSATSDWARVRTYQGAPEGLIPPTIQGVTSTTISIYLTPPSIPNGEISSSTVIVNGSDPLITRIGLEVTLSNLNPFTTYSLIHRVCTLVGCSLSTPILTTTTAGLASAMAAPDVVNISSHAAHIRWSAPDRTNGALIGYKIYQRLGCPRAYQPFYNLPCQPSELSEVSQTTNDVLTLAINDLEPYTSYQWKVEAINEVGITQSNSWSPSTSTDTSPPAYIPVPGLIYDVSGIQVMLDWTGAFKLNSQLTRYEVYVKDLSADSPAADRKYSGTDTRYSFIKAASQNALEIYVSAVTEHGTVSSPSLRIRDDSAGLITTTPESSTVVSPVSAPASGVPYVAWLVPVIVISVILVAIVFFLIIKYCARGKNLPYEREKTPIPRRQLRQSSLTPISSFHEVLRSQNGSQNQLPPPPPVQQQSIQSTSSSPQTPTTPQGLSYTKMRSVNELPVQLPYSGYTSNSGFSAEDNMNHGAMIWPSDRAVVSPPPQALLAEGSVLGQSTPRPGPSHSVRSKIKDSTTSEDDEMWDSALQDTSGMYDDSDFSEVSVDFALQPTTFTDTHL